MTSTNNESSGLGITGDETRDKDGKTSDVWSFFRTNMPDYSEDLLYGTRGPWPSPAPGRPLSEAAEVLSVPVEETKEWSAKVRATYLKILFLKWPLGLWFAYISNGSRYHSFRNEAFDRHITQGMYSKFLSQLDKGDSEIFSSVIQSGKSYVKMDFSSMDYLCGNTLEGTYAAPTIALFEKIARGENQDFDYQVRAIYIYETRNIDECVEETADVLTIEDGNRWELAKYFVLQGAVHRINLTEHGRLHFPFDSINAISKSVLPTKHPLFKLLIPFLRLSLPVNNVVLEGENSMISRTNWTVYAPFVATGKEIRKLIKYGYVGRKHKPNGFPQYIFPAGKRWKSISGMDTPLFPETDFGKFLKRYYEIFHDFVEQTLEHTLVKEFAADETGPGRRNWELIALWGQSISEWVPGFPGRSELLDESKSDITTTNLALLTRIVTLIMWNVSIAHASDHDGFGRAGPAKNVFRLRVKPPLKNVTVEQGFESKLVSSWDLFQSWLTHQLFYKPHNVTFLKDVSFDFNGLEYSERLDILAETFRANLHQCDEQMHAQYGETITRLEAVSTSIQY